MFLQQNHWFIDEKTLGQTLPSNQVLVLVFREEATFSEEKGWIFCLNAMLRRRSKTKRSRVPYAYMRVVNIKGNICIYSSRDPDLQTFGSWMKSSASCEISMPYRAQEVKENHIIEAICAGHLGSENGTELSLW